MHTTGTDPIRTLRYPKELRAACRASTHYRGRFDSQIIEISAALQPHIPRSLPAMDPIGLHQYNHPCKSTHQTSRFAGISRGERWGSNPRPPGPQPGALPTELRPPRDTRCKFSVESAEISTCPAHCSFSERETVAGSKSWRPRCSDSPRLEQRHWIGAKQRSELHT